MTRPESEKRLEQIEPGRSTVKRSGETHAEAMNRLTMTRPESEERPRGARYYMDRPESEEPREMPERIEPDYRGGGIMGKRRPESEERWLIWRNDAAHTVDGKPGPWQFAMGPWNPPLGVEVVEVVSATDRDRALEREAGWKAEAEGLAKQLERTQNTKRRALAERDAANREYQLLMADATRKLEHARAALERLEQKVKSRLTDSAGGPAMKQDGKDNAGILSDAAREARFLLERHE